MQSQRDNTVIVYHVQLVSSYQINLGPVPGGIPIDEKGAIMPWSAEEAWSCDPEVTTVMLSDAKMPATTTTNKQTETDPAVDAWGGSTVNAKSEGTFIVDA